MIPQLCSALARCILPFFGGSLSTLQKKGMSGPEVLEILQCFAMYDAHGALPFASHSLSLPLCLWSLLAAPGLLPHDEIRENV